MPGSIRAALRRPALIERGRISYSLYLTHLLVILPAVYLLHPHVPLAVIAALAFVLALPTT